MPKQRNLFKGCVFIFIVIVFFPYFFLSVIYYIVYEIPHKHTAKYSNIRSTLHRFESALEAYRCNFGILPSHDEKNYGSLPLIIYLGGNLYRGSKIPYFEFKIEFLDKQGKYLDWYGREYHYRQPYNANGTPNKEIHNKNLFDIWSEGKVSVAEGDILGEDDITNCVLDCPKCPSKKGLEHYQIRHLVPFLLAFLIALFLTILITLLRWCYRSWISPSEP